MRTLHVGLRVTDLERSLAFCTALGYEVLGDVPETEFGSLTMLKLPGDEFVTLELVHEPPRGGVDPGGLNHVVIQVESMRAAVDGLTARGVEVDAPTRPTGPRTSGPRGSPTRTATGSNWCSGLRAIPLA
jgi:lactoylglutathione lyase